MVAYDRLQVLGLNNQYVTVIEMYIYTYMLSFIMFDLSKMFKMKLFT